MKIGFLFFVGWFIRGCELCPIFSIDVVTNFSSVLMCGNNESFTVTFLSVKWIHCADGPLFPGRMVKQRCLQGDVSHLYENLILILCKDGMGGRGWDCLSLPPGPLYPLRCLLIFMVSYASLAQCCLSICTESNFILEADILLSLVMCEGVMFCSWGCGLFEI